MSYLPFTGALLCLVWLGGLELVGLFLPSEDSFTGLRDIDMRIFPESRLKAWLEVKDMPFILFISLAMGGFGGIGILSQRALEGVFGAPLNALLAVPLVVAMTVVVIKATSSAGTLPAELLQKAISNLAAMKAAKPAAKTHAQPQTDGPSEDLMHQAKLKLAALPRPPALLNQMQRKLSTLKATTMSAKKQFDKK